MLAFHNNRRNCHAIWWHFFSIIRNKCPVCYTQSSVCYARILCVLQRVWNPNQQGYTISLNKVARKWQPSTLETDISSLREENEVQKKKNPTQPNLSQVPSLPFLFQFKILPEAPFQHQSLEPGDSCQCYFLFPAASSEAKAASLASETSASLVIFKDA